MVSSEVFSWLFQPLHIPKNPRPTSARLLGALGGGEPAAAAGAAGDARGPGGAPLGQGATAVGSGWSLGMIMIDRLYIAIIRL